MLTKLPRADLEIFFLEKYEPTPLLSPWNKGCGFFKADDPGLAPLEKSRAVRFERFRRGILEARPLAESVAQADAVIRAIKARTKTNKTFQTEEQRQLLERSETYRSCLTQTQIHSSKPDLPENKRAELELDIATIQSLVAPASSPARKAQADKMKASAGYKRLLALAERRYKTLKEDDLIPSCQRKWRGPHAEWLSVAVVLEENGKPVWPSLLGTGGNDGNLDFTNNFMQQLGALFDLASQGGSPKEPAKSLLQNALWLDEANKLTKSAVGQYQPGAAGGANSSTGTGGESSVNAWDFVLMLEGSLLFTVRATRRLDPNAFSRASAPVFCSCTRHWLCHARFGKSPARRTMDAFVDTARDACGSFCFVRRGTCTGETANSESTYRHGEGDQPAWRRTRNRCVCAVRIPGAERTINFGYSSRPSPSPPQSTRVSDRRHSGMDESIWKDEAAIKMLRQGSSKQNVV